MDTPPASSLEQLDSPELPERISFERLVEAISAVLVEAGASAESAGILARNHAGCERDGALSHGVFRVPQLVATLRSGYLDGAAEPRIERVTPSYIRVDAAGGIAQLAVARARGEIERAVAEQGVAVVAIRDSQHHSALWPDLEPFAEAGRIALTMVTGGEPNVAPEGVRRRVFGTNPLAFAIPVAGALPLIADFATSSMSFGDVTLAAREGRPVAPGTGVDAAGMPTTDAAAIVDGGSLLPFGGHKGAALSMMVELLASGLTGGDFSFEAGHEKPAGAHSTRTGQLLLVIDPDRGAPAGFASRATQLVQTLREAGMDRMPADHRYRARAEAERVGIPVTPVIRELLGR